MRYVQIIVEGKVQGVFFRKHTQQIAKDLQLTGFVCNRSDGSVYIETGGEEENVQKLIDWCHKGPQEAEVTAVKVNDGFPQTYHHFEIKNTA